MPKAKKAVQKKTHIAIVLDRSGSMTNVYEAALTGVNEVISDLIKNSAVGGDTDVSLVQFDTNVEAIFEIERGVFSQNSQNSICKPTNFWFSVAIRPCFYYPSPCANITSVGNTSFQRVGK